MLGHSPIWRGPPNLSLSNCIVVDGLLSKNFGALKFKARKFQHNGDQQLHEVTIKSRDYSGHKAIKGLHAFGSITGTHGSH
jgi:hypothetical protein